MTRVIFVIKMDDFYWDTDDTNPDYLCDDEDIDIQRYNFIDWNNVDFNLNSPLLDDQYRWGDTYLESGVQHELLNLKFISDLKQCLVNYKIHARFQPSKFHNYVGLLFYHKKVDWSLNIGVSLIKETNDIFKKLKIIPEAYFRYLHAVDLSLTELQDNSDIRFYFDLYLFCYIMSLLMLMDKDQILSCESFLVRLHLVIEYQLESSVILISNPKRAWILFKEYLIIPKDNFIIHRDLLLVIKDIAVSRFQTLLFLLNEQTVNQCERNDFVEKLLNIYNSGDLLLINYGNLAYDVIKFIEPYTVLLLSKTAEKNRPLFPKFEDYNNYVKEKILEFRQSYPLSRYFFESINEVCGVLGLVETFGTFRHWGHPFIAYKDGLRELYDQTHQKKDIDINISEALASDLAFLVLRKKFKEDKTWYVDKTKIEEDDILKPFIDSDTWPTGDFIHQYGDKWHQLPLLKVFDIPDLLDPSLIYSDKSYSIDRQELVSVLQSNSSFIPTRRVLHTYLMRDATNWPKLIQEIDETGLSTNDLIIGLRPKERELKIKGRYFALMSWRLREYFVVSEYLIKEYFVPLFKGLTVADDLTSLIKKLVSLTSAHGLNDYSKITIANHLDYSKWNNHQREETNAPIFKVMDKFLGLNNFISRTHQFFQQSWIYFVGRPDLIGYDPTKNELINKRPNIMVCWNGQPGGLEGLRQKGWSITNLLMINRVSKLRNTAVQILAQGDNQVIFTSYQVRYKEEGEQLCNELIKIKNNNSYIMREVQSITSKLGLIINQDETLQSIDLMFYGKVPVFRGNVMIAKTKKWSRLNSITNDQLPNTKNIMSGLVSTALSVSHFSDNPIDSIKLHLSFGIIILKVLQLMHPIIYFDFHFPKKNELYCYIFYLYMDPSIGGVCGTNLNRFFVRSFPDPVTESLSFLKVVINSCPELKLSKFFDIPVRGFTPTDIIRLIENPTSLNLESPPDYQNLLKKIVKETLISNSHMFKNQIIKSALVGYESLESILINFLVSISPRFPRFLSEFYNATIVGLYESLINLFVNSKSIRNFCGRRSFKAVKLKLGESELKQYLWVIKKIDIFHEYYPITACTSSFADRLRAISWGAQVIGMTIPHPSELLGVKVKGPALELAGKEKYLGSEEKYLLSFGRPLDKSWFKERGPFCPYLGSKTKETTSILIPWEKEIKTPFLKRADHLRNCIGWFVKPESNLCNSIINNLTSLSGVDMSQNYDVRNRTGSAIHRFASSRQSSGGYNSITPGILTRITTTTDYFQELGCENYDFMHQSLILWTQSSHAINLRPDSNTILITGVSCSDCLRPIEDLTLDSSLTYPIVKNPIEYKLWTFNKLSVDDRISNQMNISFLDINTLSYNEKCYHVGRCTGFIFGYNQLTKSLFDIHSLFPNSIKNKVNPNNYILGLIDGLYRSCCLQILRLRLSGFKYRIRGLLISMLISLVNTLLNNQFALSFLSAPSFSQYYWRKNHPLSKSYPVLDSELRSILSQYYFQEISEFFENNRYRAQYDKMLIFSDMTDIRIYLPLILTNKIVCLLYKNDCSQRAIAIYKEVKDIQTLCNLSPKELKPMNFRRVYWIKSEVRHVIKFDKSLAIKHGPDPEPIYLSFENEFIGKINSFKIVTSNKVCLKDFKFHRQLYSPLLSFFRSAQLSTGSHYKYRTIIKSLALSWNKGFVLGDGSGGVTSMLLRLNPKSPVYFNSLYNPSLVQLAGTAPSCPSAIINLGFTEKHCPNLMTAWFEPNDLTKQDTWTFFRKQRNKVDLLILDAEADQSDRKTILLLLFKYIASINYNGKIIIKAYSNELKDKDINLALGTLAYWAKESLCVLCDLSSTSSNELFFFYNLQECEFNSGNYFLSENFLSEIEPYLYSNSSAEEEFERALKLSKMDTYQGVPHQFRLNPLPFLANLLYNCRVKGTVIHFIIERMRYSDFYNKIHFLESIFCMVCSHLLRLRLEEDLFIPSNSTLETILLFLVTSRILISFIKTEERVYLSMVSLLNKGVFFRFDPKSTKLTVSNENKNGIYKSIIMRGASYHVGNLGRAFHEYLKYYFNPTNPAPFEEDTMLVRTYTNFLTFDGIMTTDLIERSAFCYHEDEELDDNLVLQD